MLTEVCYFDTIKLCFRLWKGNKMKEYYYLDLRYGRVYLKVNNNIVQKAIWSGYNHDTYEYDASFSSENLEIREKETSLDALKDYNVEKQNDGCPYAEYVFNAFYNEWRSAKIENLLLNDEKVTSLHINSALTIAESMNDCLIFGSTSDFNGKTRDNFCFNIPEGYRNDEERGKSYLTFALENIIIALNTENCNTETLERIKKIADRSVINFESTYKSIPSSDNKKLINDLINKKKATLEKRSLNISQCSPQRVLGK